MNRKALISVWRKDGITELARALSDSGYEILSSSGTASFLRENGLPVTEISDITGIPSILGGRVKTLHPAIMGGILARRGSEADDRDRESYGIPLIDIVVCNLYPFEETAGDKNSSTSDLIEKIDIGGVSLIRAAAKNFSDVAAVTDPASYGAVIAELRQSGFISPETRARLAVAAFRATAYYDAVIERGLTRALSLSLSKTPPDAYPDTLSIPLRKRQNLRYGENPYQSAALYAPALSEPPFEQLWGKELSYNNMMDVNTALDAFEIFRGLSAAALIIKHNTPCGIAAGGSLLSAYEKALACDPVSAFGGIVGLTETVDAQTAEALNRHFFEIVAAPGFDPEALSILKSKPNIRLLRITENYGGSADQITVRKGGALVQLDALPPAPSREPDKPDKHRWIGEARYDLWDDIILAWKCAWLSKSNAISVVRDGAAVGLAGGFTNRVDAARFALSRAGEKALHAVMGSDAFFPFPDTVELAAEFGISVIIQPGGSVKDPEVEDRARSLGISMLIAGTRTFRH